MAVVQLWTKLNAAHLASKSMGVQLVGGSVSLGFMLLGVMLLLGTHQGWYKDPELTLRRYPFPPYVRFFGETLTVIYGHSYGVACIFLGLALAYRLIS